MNTLKQIETIIESGLKNKAYPGGQYALIYNNEVHTNHFGYKSLAPKIKTNGEELYDIASVTKVIATSTLVHLYIYEGLMDYETYVFEVLKDFPHQNIQIKDLLAHTSGLPAYIENANDLKTREEVIEAIYNTKLVYEKNTKIVYSCVGFITLGLLLETLTNKSLDNLAEERIFKPLNMTSTTYHPNPLLAAPTEYRDDNVYQGYLVGKVHDGLAYALGNVSGNAGVFSTARDLAIFIKRLLNNDFIFPKEVIDKLFNSYIRIEQKDGIYNRSLGWAKPAEDKNSIIYHTGYTGCVIVIDRKQNQGFVMLTNGVHPKRENNNVFPYRSKIIKLLFGY